MDKGDVFLFPGITDAEGRCEVQGLVIQEAQSMELPVVISDVGGMQEGMLDQKTGFVVKAQDVDAFLERLEYMINHPEQKEQLGKSGRAFVEEKYDIQVLGKKMLDIYTN